MYKLLLALALLASPLAAADTYSIAYVRMPRTEADKPSFPEVLGVADINAAADLVLRAPGGTEKVLVDCSTTCAVMDLSMSLDGQSIYYALVHDPTLRDATHGQVPRNGVSIHRVAVAGGAPVEIVPVGDYEMPNPTDKKPTFKVMNTGPQELPGGKLIFTSNRFGHKPPKGRDVPDHAVVRPLSQRRDRAHRTDDHRLGTAPGVDEGRRADVLFAGEPGLAPSPDVGHLVDQPGRTQLGAVLSRRLSLSRHRTSRRR